MRKFEVKEEFQLPTVASEIAKSIKPGMVIGFIGDLGAGKTTLIRQLVHFFDDSIKVKSPTFSLVNEYHVNNSGIKTIKHLDLYRFENPVELEALALEQENDTVTFVEWPNIFEERSFPVHEEIRIEVADDDSRIIHVSF